MSIDNNTTSQDRSQPTDKTLKSPPTGAKNTKVVLGAGVPGRRRQYSVRIIVPPEKFTNREFDGENEGALVQIIKQVQSKANVKQIEILIHPSPIGLVINLHGIARGIDGRSVNQAGLESFDAGIHAGVQNNLVAAAKELTSGLGIETGTLDLDPVGISPVTTSRLLLGEDDQIGHQSNFDSNPLEETLTELKANHEPYIYQFIVGGSGGTDGYQGTARLAPYNPQYTHNGDHGFAKLVDQGSPVDLANAFSHLNLTSNHQLDTSEVFDIEYINRIGSGVDAEVGYNYVTKNQYRTGYHIRREADSLRELILGTREYVGLLNGNASTHNSRYEEYNKYGWFSIEPGQLPLFSLLVPLQMETNPWLLLDGRSAPIFDTDDVIRKIGELPQGLGTQRNGTSGSTSGVVNEGSFSHQEFVEFLDRYFTEQGDTIMIVNQNTDSVPDLWLFAEDGEIVTLDKPVDSKRVPVEAEYKNNTKPAGTLTNAERAVACGQHAVFAYQSKDAAETGCETLYQAYRGQTEFGIWLYNDSDSITCEDGRTPVVEGPAKTTRAVWEINAAGTKRLSVGETVVTTLDSNTALTDGDYDYYHREDGTTHYIETEDGDIVAEYTNDDAFKANWTKIARPFHTADYHYGQHTTVLYRSETTDTGIEELKRYSHTPSWQDDFQDAHGTVDKLTVAMENFLEAYVVEADGGKTPVQCSPRSVPNLL
jgi:hypothetical protein